MGNVIKWGAIILGIWIVIRWAGGLTANVAGSLQPGSYMQPQWPYYPAGVVQMYPGLVSSVGTWQANQYWPGKWEGPQHGIPTRRRPRP